MHRILFICHGNICRSTMAESVMKELVRRVGRSDEFAIDSAATSREEIGNPPHRGTVRKLQEVGIPVAAHRARQMRADELDRWDFVVCMDEENLRSLRRIVGKDAFEEARGTGKIAKLLAFAGAGVRRQGVSTGDAAAGRPAASKGASDGLASGAQATSDRVPDVADPWYTGDFDATYRDVLAGCEGLLAKLAPAKA